MRFALTPTERPGYSFPAGRDSVAYCIAENKKKLPDMKTVILILAAMVTALIAAAQKNNPFDQRGVDYFTSLELVVNDINNGVIRQYSDEVIRAYSQKVPLKSQANLQLATEVYKTVHDPSLTVEQFLKQSGISDFAAEMTMQLITPAVPAGGHVQDYLVKLVGQINDAGIDKTEKEILLTLAAISYHGQDRSLYSRRGCVIRVSEVSTEIGATACIVAVAAVGAYTGMQICGGPCALGGAIIGGIIGAVATVS